VAVLSDADEVVELWKKPRHDRHAHRLRPLLHPTPKAPGRARAPDRAGLPGRPHVHGLAQTAERAGVGMLFFGDAAAPSTLRGSHRTAVEWGIQWPRHDMAPVIAAMSTVTERIGFGLTYLDVHASLHVAGC